MTRHTIFRDFCREVPAARAVGAEALVDRYSGRREGIASATEVNGASRLLAELRDRNVPTFINSATPTSALQDAVKARGWDRFVSAALGARGRRRQGRQPRGGRAAGRLCTGEVAHVGDGATTSRRAALRLRLLPHRRRRFRDIAALTGVAGAPRVTGAGEMSYL